MLVNEAMRAVGLTMTDVGADVAYIFIGIAIIAALFPAAWGLGLFASRGWHRGKQEFLDSVMRRSSSFNGKGG